MLSTKEAYGRAYGTGRSHARSPYLQHRPPACWGRCPQTPFLSINLYISQNIIPIYNLQYYIIYTKLLSILSTNLKVLFYI